MSIPGVSIVDDEQRDALVLRERRVGAHVAEALLRDRRVRRPHFLAVHHEVVVVHFGARLQAREVGSRVRLAHADAPDRVAADCARRHRLLFVVAELQQARRDDRVTGEVARPRDAPAREGLEVDEGLHGCAVTAAELGRVARDHPAMVEEGGLPVAHPLRDELVLVADVAGEVEAAEHFVGGVRIQERHEVGAKRLVFRPPSELHPVSRLLTAFLTPIPDIGVRNGSRSCLQSASRSSQSRPSATRRAA